MSIRQAVAIFLTLLLTTHAAAGNSDDDSPTCDTFLAPSKVSGWGVFAARDFAANELAEIAPLNAPFPQGDATIRSTALYDYTYGSAVSFGHIMIYNHSQNPNVRIHSLIGVPPQDNSPGALSATICYTLREIKAGEELFSKYKKGDDSDENWFQPRGLEMGDASISSTRIPSEQLEQYKRTFCSKAIAGMGVYTFVNGLHGDQLPFKFDIKRLPREDSSWATAKTSIHAEDRIEIAPALVLPLALVGPMIPLSIQWDHLTERHQKILRKLRDTGHFRVVRKNAEGRTDGFESFDTAVLLPIGGNVGLIQRVGSDNPNCRLEIIGSGAADGNAGLVLDIVAMRDIQVGETLRLNIQPSGTVNEKRALREVLKRSNQPIPHYLEEIYEQNCNSVT